MRLPRAPKLLLAAGLALLTVQAAPAATPVYHGVLGIRGGGGPFDPNTGQATFKVRRWKLFLADGTDANSPPSDGISPADEPVFIEIGATEEFVIPAGALKSNRKGTKFTYRNRNKDLTRRVHFFRLQRTKRGDWKVKFTLVGVDLSTLTLDPFLDAQPCLDMAVIVGDDDGFTGMKVARAGGFSGKRFKVMERCTPDDWPWL